MAKAKRTIKDSFPPVDYLDREELRETFIRLAKKNETSESKPSRSVNGSGNAGKAVKTGASVRLRDVKQSRSSISGAAKDTGRSGVRAARVKS